MTKKIALAATALVGSLGLLMAGAQAASLNVKPGLWETTSTGTMSGMPPIPQADLDKMPPATRARMQAMMAAAMGAASKPIVVKSCMTQAQIDNAFVQMDKNPGHCARTVLTGSATEQSFKLVCNNDHGAMTGTFHVAAPSPTAVNGVFDMTVVGNGNTMKMHRTLAGRWLGADCGNIKPGSVNVN